MIVRRFQIGLLTIVAAGLVVLAGARGALGFDSAGSEFGLKTHNIPSPPPNFPHGGNFMLPDKATQESDPFCIQNGCPPGESWQSGLKYLSKTIHYSLGGLVGDGTDDGAVLGIYSCPRDAVTSQVDLSKCTVPVAHRTGLEPTQIAWLQVRRTWDQRAPEGTAMGGTGHAPEHMYILQEAASLAGFDHIKLLKDRFWVRYPVDDHYLVTPIEADPPVEPVDPERELSRYYVGQSWLPVGFRDVSRRVGGRDWSLAVRGVSLPELAQLPDVSNSLWDWAAGNEECPVDGISENGHSAFGNSAYDLNACHDFKRVMGAINSSHFLPSARSFYDHYHALAMRRMAKCNDLAPLIHLFYNDDVEALIALGYTPRYASPHNTEAHECEREAMAYEMVAQHYLQDAWSTGHMWKRWGYPNLSMFPATLGPSPYSFSFGGITIPLASDADVPPLENVAPRRFIVAALTAAYAGVIHGAKGVVSDLWRKGTLNSNINPPKFADDPLCGPTYIAAPDGTQRPVEWRDAAEQGLTYSGVGDMFWDPYGADTIKLKGSPIVPPDGTSDGIDGGNQSVPNDQYVEQRKRLLGCSAASLREVYAAGPRAHGELSPYQATFDPSGYDCWEHWATNSSMLGALGPMRLTRDWGPIYTPKNWLTTLAKGVFLVANALTFSDRFDAARFDDDSPEGVADKESFKSSLLIRSTLDSIVVETTMRAHAEKDPNGTESAQLIHADGSGAPVSYLTIPPNEELSSSALLTSFADRDPPREAEPQDFGVELNHPEDHYLARMFWRSHLDELCTDTTLVLALRDRCVAAADFGGDPDACTACVDVAEAFIPPCGRVAAEGAGFLGESKCEVLTGSQAAVPEWYDEEERHDSASWVSCGYPSYFLAITFCTATDPRLVSDATEFRRELSSNSLDVDPSDPCDTASPPRRVVYRRGVLHSELSPQLPVPSVPGPVISAYNVQSFFENVQVHGFCVPRIITDRDTQMEDYIGRPLWNDVSQGNAALWPGFSVNPPEIFFCGVTQRLDWFNESCEGILGSMDGLPPENRYDPSTGLQWIETPLRDNPEEQRCSVRWPRAMRGSCPTGQCNASGVCVGGHSATSPGFEFSDRLW